MPGKKSRIIIDTNLWISFLLRKDYSMLDDLLSAEDVILIFSDELLDEFVSVTKRPKFRKYFDPGDIHELLLRIYTTAIFVDVITEATACRDPKDNFLLSLAMESEASHLITGDKDLLVLKKYGNTTIVTISEFLNNI